MCDFFFSRHQQFLRFNCFKHQIGIQIRQISPYSKHTAHHPSSSIQGCEVYLQTWNSSIITSAVVSRRAPNQFTTVMSLVGMADTPCLFQECTPATTWKTSWEASCCCLWLCSRNNRRLILQDLGYLHMCLVGRGRAMCFETILADALILALRTPHDDGIVTFNT